MVKRQNCDISSLISTVLETRSLWAFVHFPHSPFLSSLNTLGITAAKHSHFLPVPSPWPSLGQHNYGQVSCKDMGQGQTEPDSLEASPLRSLAESTPSEWDGMPPPHSPGNLLTVTSPDGLAWSYRQGHISCHLFCCTLYFSL